MDNDIRYSVILLTYKRDDMLRKAIASVFRQTKLPQQLIVIDNYMKGDTRKLVDEITPPGNCEILFLECPDVNTARNIAVTHATGNYLAFLDDDDYWHDDYLKRVAETIKEKQVEMVMTRVTNYNEKNEFREGKVPPTDFHIEDFYLRNPGILCTNFVVSLKRFNAVKGYDEIIGSSSDKDLFMRLKEDGCLHYVLMEELVYWRVHEKNWSNSASRLLPDILKFYRKYFFRMGIKYHLLMWKKFSLLIFAAYLRPRFRG